jgi:hypothetical protein
MHQHQLDQLCADAACIGSASNTVAIMQHYDGLLAAVAYSTTRNQHRWTDAI